LKLSADNLRYLSR